MLVELSYWDIEEAVIDYLKKKYGWKVDSDQIQGGDVETSCTTYVYMKNKEGDEVVDRDKSTTKKKNLQFDGNSELRLFIEEKEEEKKNA
jgi:hypothetical protein